MSHDRRNGDEGPLPAYSSTAGSYAHSSPASRYVHSLLADTNVNMQRTLSRWRDLATAGSPAAGSSSAARRYHSAGPSASSPATTASMMHTPSASSPHPRDDHLGTSVHHASSPSPMAPPPSHTSSSHAAPSEAEAKLFASAGGNPPNVNDGHRSASSPSESSHYGRTVPSQDSVHHASSSPANELPPLPHTTTSTTTFPPKRRLFVDPHLSPSHPTAADDSPSAAKAGDPSAAYAADNASEPPSRPRTPPHWANASRSHEVPSAFFSPQVAPGSFSVPTVAEILRRLRQPQPQPAFPSPQDRSERLDPMAENPPTRPQQPGVWNAPGVDVPVTSFPTPSRRLSDPRGGGDGNDLWHGAPPDHRSAPTPPPPTGHITRDGDIIREKRRGSHTNTEAGGSPVPSAVEEIVRERGQAATTMAGRTGVRSASAERDGPAASSEAATTATHVHVARSLAREHIAHWVAGTLSPSVTHSRPTDGQGAADGSVDPRILDRHVRMRRVALTGSCRGDTGGGPPAAADSSASANGEVGSVACQVNIVVTRSGDDAADPKEGGACELSEEGLPASRIVLSVKKEPFDDATGATERDHDDDEGSRHSEEQPQGLGWNAHSSAPMRTSSGGADGAKLMMMKEEEVVVSVSYEQCAWNDTTERLVLLANVAEAQLEQWEARHVKAATDLVARYLSSSNELLLHRLLLDINVAADDAAAVVVYMDAAACESLHLGVVGKDEMGGAEGPSLSGGGSTAAGNEPFVPPCSAAQESGGNAVPDALSLTDAAHSLSSPSFPTGHHAAAADDPRMWLLAKRLVQACRLDASRDAVHALLGAMEGARPSPADDDGHAAPSATSLASEGASRDDDLTRGTGGASATCRHRVETALAYLVAEVEQSRGAHDDRARTVDVNLDDRSSSLASRLIRFIEEGGHSTTAASEEEYSSSSSATPPLPSIVEAEVHRRLGIEAAERAAGRLDESAKARRDMIDLLGDVCTTIVGRVLGDRERLEGVEADGDVSRRQSKPPLIDAYNAACANSDAAVKWAAVGAEEASDILHHGIAASGSADKDASPFLAASERRLALAKRNHEKANSTTESQTGAARRAFDDASGRVDVAAAELAACYARLTAAVAQRNHAMKHLVTTAVASLTAKCLRASHIAHMEHAHEAAKRFASQSLCDRHALGRLVELHRLLRSETALRTTSHIDGVSAESSSSHQQAIDRGLVGAGTAVYYALCTLAAPWTDAQYRNIARETAKYAELEVALRDAEACYHQEDRDHCQQTMQACAARRAAAVSELDRVNALLTIASGRGYFRPPPSFTPLRPPSHGASSSRPPRELVTSSSGRRGGGGGGSSSGQRLFSPCRRHEDRSPQHNNQLLGPDGHYSAHGRLGIPIDDASPLVMGRDAHSRSWSDPHRREELLGVHQGHHRTSSTQSTGQQQRQQHYSAIPPPQPIVVVSMTDETSSSDGMASQRGAAMSAVIDAFSPRRAVDRPSSPGLLTQSAPIQRGGQKSARDLFDANDAPTRTVTSTVRQHDNDVRCGGEVLATHLGPPVPTTAVADVLVVEADEHDEGGGPRAVFTAAGGSGTSEASSSSKNTPSRCLPKDRPHDDDQDDDATVKTYDGVPFAVAPFSASHVAAKEGDLAAAGERLDRGASEVGFDDDDDENVKLCGPGVTAWRGDSFDASSTVEDPAVTAARPEMSDSSRYHAADPEGWPCAIAVREEGAYGTHQQHLAAAVGTVGAVRDDDDAAIHQVVDAFNIDELVSLFRRPAEVHLRWVQALADLDIVTGRDLRDLVGSRFVWRGALGHLPLFKAQIEQLMVHPSKFIVVEEEEAVADNEVGTVPPASHDQDGGWKDDAAVWASHPSSMAPVPSSAAPPFNEAFGGGSEQPFFSPRRHDANPAVQAIMIDPSHPPGSSSPGLSRRALANDDVAFAFGKHRPEAAVASVTEVPSIMMAPVLVSCGINQPVAAATLPMSSASLPAPGFVPPPLLPPRTLAGSGIARPLPAPELPCLVPRRGLPPLTSSAANTTLDAPMSQESGGPRGVSSSMTHHLAPLPSPPSDWPEPLSSHGAVGHPGGMYPSWRPAAVEELDRNDESISLTKSTTAQTAAASRSGSHRAHAGDDGLIDAAPPAENDDDDDRLLMMMSVAAATAPPPPKATASSMGQAQGWWSDPGGQRHPRLSPDGLPLITMPSATTRLGAEAQPLPPPTATRTTFVQRTAAASSSYDEDEPLYAPPPFSATVSQYRMYQHGGGGGLAAAASLPAAPSYRPSAASWMAAPDP